MGQISKFLAAGQDFFSSPGFPINIQGKGVAVHTWWVQQFCDSFCEKGDVYNMVLGENPAGYGFVLRDLVSIELFQIGHNCVTECTRKTFVKTYLKAIRDTSFSQYVEFPNMLYFHPTEGESSNFYACRETLLLSSLALWDMLIPPLLKP